MKSPWIAAALVLIAFSSHLQATEPATNESNDGNAQSFDRHFVAHAIIGADGKVESLQWRSHARFDNLVAPRLDAVVRQWTFNPGTIGGQPARTETAVQLKVHCSAHPDGSLGLRIIEAATGAEADNSKVRASDIVMAAGVQESGLIRTTVAIDEKGIGSLDSYTYNGPAGAKSAFVRAARGIIRATTFYPEIVGGRPLPTHAILPIKVCFDDLPCKKYEDSGKVADDDSTPTPLESVVRLTSNFAGKEI